jgi:predicted protein tyrosine phosphatase
MEYITYIFSKVYEYLFPFAGFHPPPIKKLDPSRHQVMCSNPSEIIPGFLYLSDISIPLDPKALQKHGFTHVLTLTPRSFETPLPSNIIHNQIRVRDSSASMISGYFEETYAFFEGARLNNGKVLVHCEAGVSRSATITISYVMRHLNMTLREAFEYVKERRQIISPNLGFMSQLKAYERLHNKSSDIEDSFLAEYILDTLGVQDVTKEQMQQALILHNNDPQQALLYLFPANPTT